MISATKLTRPLFASVLVAFAVGVVVCAGCKKDEPPPPMPSSEPEPSAAPAEVVKPVEEPSAEPSAPKPTGVGGPGVARGLKACCNALWANSKSAPEPQASQLKQAAAACDGLAKTGANPSAIRGLLGGVAIPGACM